MEKQKVTFSLSKELIELLNKLSREQLPNKSALVEELLIRWLNTKMGDDDDLD